MEILDFLYYIMNYRTFYQKKTGIKLLKNYEVHHLDHDRNNNSIINLVAVPKKLHSNYHKSYNKFIIALEDLKLFRDFNFIIKKRINEDINNFMIIRSELAQYEYDRDFQLHNNSKIKI